MTQRVERTVQKQTSGLERILQTLVGGLDSQSAIERSGGPFALNLDQLPVRVSLPPSLDGIIILSIVVAFLMATSLPGLWDEGVVFTASRILFTLSVTLGILAGLKFLTRVSVEFKKDGVHTVYESPIGRYSWSSFYSQFAGLRLVRLDLQSSGSFAYRLFRLQRNTRSFPRDMTSSNPSEGATPYLVLMLEHRESTRSIPVFAHAGTKLDESIVTEYAERLSLPVLPPIDWARGLRRPGVSPRNFR